MKKKLKEIELRSDEVQEILTIMPHWLIRWGNLVVLGILILLLVFSWFIKYPDLIQTNIVITTAFPPEKVVARSPGRIDKIFVDDKQVVSKGSVLAVLGNSANYEDVFYLKSILDSIKIEGSEVIFPKITMPYLSLGDIENYYGLFEKEYLIYKLNQELLPYEIQKKAQSLEQQQQQERINLLIQQSDIGKRELNYKKRELERYKSLFEKGIISTQEWESKSLDFLQQEKNQNGLHTQISQLRSVFNNLISDRETTKLNKQRDDINFSKNVVVALNQLKKAIAEWELVFTLKASIDGKVSFLQVWSANQSVVAGDEMFVIVPNNRLTYIGKVKASTVNSGKIKLGQKVIVKLVNFPDQEFGVIEGKVNSISLTPDKDNNILIDVSLVNGLETSYHKTINFQQEMTGTADIITEDLRLIERLLYQFRDLFRR